MRLRCEVYGRVSRGGGGGGVNGGGSVCVWGGGRGQGLIVL